MTDMDCDSEGLSSRAESETPKPQAPRVKHHHEGKARIRMEVVQARSLGPFRLGTPLHMIMGQLHKMGCCASSAVALNDDGIVTHIMADSLGLVLCFHPRTLLLETIRAVNLSLLELAHKEGALCGRGYTPTFVRLYQLLGPTFAGVINVATGEYVLSYPGLDVLFRIPAAHREFFADGSHPVTLPDGTTPVALEFHIREAKQGTLTVPSWGSFVAPWSQATIKWGEGIIYTPWQSDVATAEPVSFEDSVQDILSLMGAPETWMSKDDSRMQALSIPPNASADSLRHGSMRPSPLFALGYPCHGVDFLFASSTGKLQKIVLYTGVQHHESFLHYHRCWFEWTLTTADAFRILGQRPEADASRPVQVDDTLTVSPITKWSELSSFLAVAGPLPRPLLAAAPEGTLLIWALCGVCFTVVQQTDLIACVTLVLPRGIGLPRAGPNSDAIPVSLTPIVLSAPPSRRTSPQMGSTNPAPDVAIQPLDDHGGAALMPPHISDAPNLPRSLSTDFEDLADDILNLPPIKNGDAAAGTIPRSNPAEEGPVVRDYFDAVGFPGFAGFAAPFLTTPQPTSGIPRDIPEGQNEAASPSPQRQPEQVCSEIAAGADPIASAPSMQLNSSTKVFSGEGTSVKDRARPDEIDKFFSSTPQETPGEVKAPIDSESSAEGEQHSPNTSHMNVSTGISPIGGGMPAKLPTPPASELPAPLCESKPNASSMPRDDAAADSDATPLAPTSVNGTPVMQPGHSPDDADDDQTPPLTPECGGVQHAHTLKVGRRKKGKKNKTPH